MTLARISKLHPVFVGVDWTVRPFYPPNSSKLPFVALQNVEGDEMAALKAPAEHVPEVLHHLVQHFLILGPREEVTPLAEYAEIILGADFAEGRIL